MITKLVRWQLIVFLVVGVVALAYTGLRYARLDRPLGVGGGYSVTVKSPDSGGIFTNAQVTYRGVPLGRVGKLTLTEAGVDVELLIDGGKPKIPSNSRAVIANKSAIGEQYVDLQPTSDEGPYLGDGSTLANVSLPPKLDEFVKDAVRFTDSIPIKDLHTVIDELGKAFSGQGQNLTHLVNSLSELAKTGYDNLPETISLIRNSNVVLSTQAEQSDEILSWAHNLTLITAQLQASDPDVRRLLTTGATSATQLIKLLDRSGGDIGTAVKDLATDIRHISGSLYGIPFLFAVLPGLSAGSFSPPTGDGTTRFGVILETGNPPVCTYGYESTHQMIAEMKRKNPKFDVNYDDFPFNIKADCRVAQGNPTGVRSGRRVIFADPNTKQPWDNNRKKDPDRLNLTPIATQLAAILGIHGKK